MRQGNDRGTSYRSIIIVADDEQRAVAEASKAAYQKQLSAAGYGTITTEIVDAATHPFYYAEDYHQQYLDKNPRGYCPNHSTGVELPNDFVVTPLQYVTDPNWCAARDSARSGEVLILGRKSSHVAIHPLAVVRRVLLCPPRLRAACGRAAYVRGLTP